LDPPPSRVQRSVTMPIPGLPHLAQVAPGPYQSYHLQAPIMSHSQSDSGVLGATQIPIDHQRYLNGVEEESDYEEDRDDSATHSGGALAKGPPGEDRPLAGRQRERKSGNRRKQPSGRAQTLATLSPPARGTNDPPNGFRARLRNLVSHGLGSQPQNQTATPVRPPQQATFRCRLPECQVSITGEVAARLSGFCCDNHMWTAIERPIATLCPGCNQRACPEGKAFCSAECANWHWQQQQQQQQQRH